MQNELNTRRESIQQPHNPNLPPFALDPTVLLSVICYSEFSQVKVYFLHFINKKRHFQNQSVFLFDKNRNHSGYFEQTLNILKCNWQVQDLCGQENIQLCDAHTSDLGKKCCHQNPCSLWLPDVCKLSRHYSKIYHTELHSSLTSRSCRFTCLVCSSFKRSWKNQFLTPSLGRSLKIRNSTNTG